MKKPILLKLVAVVLLLNSYVGSAQAKPVTDLLKQYINASNNLGNSKEKSTVLVLLDKKYQNNTAYVGLSSVIKRSTSGYDQVSSQLDESIENNKYSFTMNIRDIVHETQKEKAGTVSAVVNFESKIDGKVAETGTILMNLVGTMIKGNWKITQNNTVRVSEGKDIGSCVCYLFSKGTSFFGAETYYPGGVEYNKKFESFRVVTRDGERIIKGDNNNYTWSGDGNILEGSRKIGNANTTEEAVKVVLNFLYAESCTKIDFH